MEIQRFTEKTERALGEYYGKEAEIKQHTVYKNNGILLHGICVLQNGKNIAPAVYLNSFWERYKNGESFGILIKEIINFMEENQVSGNFDTDFFKDYGQVKRKLVIRLIHLEKNKELLNRVPYIKFQDLAIVCHCLLVTDEIGVGTILIHKEHLAVWKISEKELFQDALENSPKLEPCHMLKMSDMIKNILYDSVCDKIDEICEEYACDKEMLLDSTLANMAKEIEEKHIPMYVLTNEKRFYGAACVAYPDMMEYVAEKLQDDFYILPSSIHEVIIVAKRECVDSYTLNEMIEEVNKTQVEEEEWLSNHTYLYQRKNQKLISVTNH